MTIKRGGNEFIELTDQMLTIKDALDDAENKICMCYKCSSLRKELADEYNFIKDDLASKQFIRNVIDKEAYTYCFRVMRSISVELVEYLNENNSAIFFIADDPEEGVKDSSYF